MGMGEYLEKFLFGMKFMLLLFLCDGHVLNFFFCLILYQEPVLVCIFVFCI